MHDTDLSEWAKTDLTNYANWLVNDAENKKVRPPLSDLAHQHIVTEVKRVMAELAHRELVERWDSRPR